DEDGAGWLDVPLASGVTASSVQQRLQQRRLGDGMVELRGFVETAETLPTTPTQAVIGTLPVRSRPARLVRFHVNTGMNAPHQAAMHTVEIDTSGVIRTRSGRNGTTWLSLDGIRFDTSAATGWTNIPLAVGITTPSGSAPLS
ncbi:hypothetical protein, partial [Enterobacter hormaechei]|uniref:hypothetical protein n=1 Tax=Enterobacter hormaechei TaxID=158836 RepID=UPI0025A17119